MSFIFQPKVIDNATGKPIVNASIKIVRNSSVFLEQKTTINGETEIKIPIGYYLVIVNAEGYETLQTSGMVNKQIRYATFRLDPLPQRIVTEIDENIPLEKPLVIEKTPKIKIDTIKRVREPFVEENPTFPLDAFSPNNIVFLIDVSSSMNKRNRIGLVKIAMVELLNMLRSIDKLAILTYATETEVIMPPSTADNKSQITKMINSLVAEGFTNGGKGIREAIQVAQANFIEEGNNQIIVITDGDFEIQNDKELLQLVKKSAKEEIYISVIGVKNGSLTYESLQELARKGNGTYLKLNNAEEAQTSLVNEIRLRSKKN